MRAKRPQSSNSDPGGYWACLVAALGGFMFGYDGSVVCGGQILFREHFLMNPGQFGLTMAASALGCVAAPIPCAALCHRGGSERVLAMSAALLILGGIGAAAALNVPMLVAFRMASGFGVGMISLASPLYIAETAPPRYRGRLGFLYQIDISAGALAGILAAWALARWLPGAAAWRSMLCSEAILSLFFLAPVLRLPPRPGPVEGCPAESVVPGADRSREGGSYRELFQPGYRLALGTGILLALFNTWTGWTGIAAYLPTLFQKAGYPVPSDAVGITVIPTALGLVCTLAAAALVDHVGRRPLWIGASVAMMVSLLALGAAFHHGVHGPVAVAAILIIVLPHAFGLGPIPWLMISEIFPANVRARAIGVCTTALWIATFFIVWVLPKTLVLSEKMFGSAAGVFWGFTVVCLFSAIFGWRMLPETRGRTLEQIAQHWAARTPS